jgi:putative Mg2+ transporter-C (MgtC) family protein
LHESFSEFLNTLSDYGPRLAGSLIAGCIIGMEGEIFRRAAGLRTTLLIMLGTTVFSILSLAISQQYGGDPGRIAAQIVTGIGFLGAGVIMHAGGEVHGITTAATIFSTAAIGVTIGFGYVYSGVALSFIAAGILILFRPVHRFIQNLKVIRKYRDKEFKATFAERDDNRAILRVRGKQRSGRRKKDKK